MLKIDLTKLDDAQLSALAALSPEFADPVKEEAKTRRMYVSVEAGLQELFKAAVALEASVLPLKRTAARTAVAKSGILDVISRLLLTAEVRNGVRVDRGIPVVIQAEQDQSHAEE